MKNQEVFNLVWDHFIVKKNGPGYFNDRCTYRGEDGSRCAVGLIIPDELYFREVEGERVTEIERRLSHPLASVRENTKRLMEFFNQFDIDFLQDLQDAHDQCAAEQNFTPSFKECLYEIAERYELTIPKSY